MKLNLEPLAIRPFLGDIVAVYREMDHGKPVKIRMEGKFFDVMADPMRLRQVVQNLLDNAIKYSGPSVEIIVQTKVLEDIGLISVSDNGMGIPEESLQNLRQVLSGRGGGHAHSRRRGPGPCHSQGICPDDEWRGFGHKRERSRLQLYSGIAAGQGR